MVVLLLGIHFFTSYRAYASFQRGFDLAEQGAFEEAIPLLEKSLGPSVHKDKALIYYVRGTVYLNLGENDRAITDFNRAIEYDYSEPDIYFNRAMAFLRSEKFELGKKDLETFLQLAVSDPSMTEFISRAQELLKQ